MHDVMCTWARACTAVYAHTCIWIHMHTMIRHTHILEVSAAFSPWYTCPRMGLE